MSVKDDGNKRKRFSNCCSAEMVGMMQNFCSNEEWTSDCCPRFLRMYRPDSECDDCVMTMCEEMWKKSFNQAWMSGKI